MAPARAKEAVEVGLELAAEQGTDVTFVHVLRPDESHRGRGSLRRPSRRIRPYESETALAEAACAAEEAGVSYELHRMSGDTVDKIIAVADAKDADLVVVGSRWRGAVALALLGSVSNDLMKRAERDVFVVKTAPARVAA